MKRFVLAILAVLVGCAAPPAAQTQWPRNGPPARIDLARALAHHPFASVLAQYDADIATLRRAAGIAAFTNVHQAIDANAADLDRRLKTASSRLHGLRTQAIRAPRPARAGSSSVFGSKTIASFEQAAQARVARALDLRAAQLRESEATAAFDFDRAHAGRRLVLGLKLRDLHLDKATRRRFESELGTLDRQEAALLENRRRSDRGVLAAYQERLRAQALADSASMASDVTAHTKAMHDLPRPAMPALPDAMLHPDAQNMRDAIAFDGARRDLTARLFDLRSRDDAARDDVRTEITALVRERDALRAQIVASIEARAERIAGTERLGRVYEAGAPRGARDITGEVERSYSVSTGS
ncbi:MAG: hypothetical protein WB615_03285 [Candidatus Tumulicola sp.]